MANPLCTMCGGPMQLTADGHQYQCSRAPERHPVIRVRGSLKLEGNWVWANLTASVITVLAAAVWWAGLRGFSALREPLLVAFALAMNGFVAGFAPAFAFRMNRPNSVVWNVPVYFLELGLLTGMSFAALSWWAIFLMQKDASAWPLVLGAMGWALGLASGFLPYAVKPVSPGERLARRLGDRRGRESAADAACVVPGCGNLAISCEGHNCQRRMCGTHWIQAEGRCNSCGHSFLAQPEIPVRHQPARWGLLAALTMGWLGVVLGGYFFVRLH